MLPKIDLGPYRVSRLIVGGNPFSGNSHQTPERSRQMLDWYTCDRIKQTLRECEEVGINAAVLRADAHMFRLYHEYRNEGGTIHWIAQIGPEFADYERNIDTAIGYGAMGVYVQGGMTRRFIEEGRMGRIGDLVEHIRKRGAVAGVCAHHPDELGVVAGAGIDCDFYMACFYDCGSIHDDEGEAFPAADRPRACEFIRETDVPCLAFKVMAAGRNEPTEALKYAFDHIKPIDAVVVGVFTKDNPDMVRENAQRVAQLVGAAQES